MVLLCVMPVLNTLKMLCWEFEERVNVSPKLKTRSPSFKSEIDLRPLTLLIIIVCERHLLILIRTQV